MENKLMNNNKKILREEIFIDNISFEIVIMKTKTIENAIEKNEFEKIEITKKSKDSKSKKIKVISLKNKEDVKEFINACMSISLSLADELFQENTVTNNTNNTNNTTSPIVLQQNTSSPVILKPLSIQEKIQQQLKDLAIDDLIQSPNSITKINENDDIYKDFRDIPLKPPPILKNNN
jgi:hypothetical protein